MTDKSPTLARTIREVVPGAGLWFDELGARETVAHLAGAWFMRHLAAGRLQ